MVNKVLSFSQNGLTGWFLQRITSLVIAVYSLYILGFIVAHPQMDYSTWRDLYEGIGMRIFSLIFLLSLLFHTWIGIWTVLTDYLKQGMLRLTFQLLLVITLLIFFIWGIVILWSVGS